MSILICAPFAPVTAWSQQLYIDTLLAVDYPREEIVVFIPMEADKCERCNRDDGGWEIWQPLLKFQRDYRKEFASIELDAWDSLGLQEMSLKGVAISVARNRAHYRVRRDPTITHICMLDSDVRPYDPTWLRRMLAHQRRWINGVWFGFDTQGRPYGGLVPYCFNMVQPEYGLNTPGMHYCRNIDWGVVAQGRDDRVVSVDIAGTGFTLLTRDVSERVLSRMTKTPEDPCWAGEDVYFNWDYAAAFGEKPVVDLSLVAYHYRDGGLRVP